MNGWLVLDKPLGITSAHAVAKVKRLLKPEKIGHAGTLDPLASGVLPLALGEATKTVQFMMEAQKAYRFTVTFGESRTTDDAEGEVTATSPVRPTFQQIQEIIPSFTGRILQAPPAYSAIKMEGKRAYALARAGSTPEMKAREVEVIDIQVSEYNENYTVFSVTCGKGTYVRSLARDMALALGTVGYVSALRRTRVGVFDEMRAISLETLEKIVHNSALNWLHPVESVLDDIPAWEVDSALAARIRKGQLISVDSALTLPQGSLVQAKSGGKLVAVLRVGEGAMISVRVFNSA